MKLKRYDIKKLLADPARRRMMIAESTVVTMAREGIDITLAESLASYDQVMKEKHEKEIQCKNRLRPPKRKRRLKDFKLNAEIPSALRQRASLGKIFVGDSDHEPEKDWVQKV